LIPIKDERFTAAATVKPIEGSAAVVRSRRLLLLTADQLRAIAQKRLSFGQTAKSDETAQIFMRQAILFDQQAETLR
jgi:hypothetical protein